MSEFKNIVWGVIESSLNLFNSNSVDLSSSVERNVDS